MRTAVYLFLCCTSLTELADAYEKSSRPNILLAIADDASYPHMSAYGCDWVNTPGFDRVAREGLLFTRGYTPNAKCAPSRSCLLTGRNSWQLEAAANHVPFFPPKFIIYPEALDEAGYHVGMTGKGWAPGVAQDENGKPRQLAGKPYGGNQSTPPAKGISNTDYAANFADFLAAKPADAPFCFWYGGHEPHRGYEYGSGIRQTGRTLSDVDNVPDYWPDDEITRTDMLDYAFEVEYFDSHLARMLKALDDAGELDNTLVVVTSDNGMPFPRCKGNAYETSMHMPLAIMWPNGIEQPGRTVDDYVSFIDLAPTFLEAAGVDWKQSGLHSTPGRSLMKIFRGQSTDVAHNRLIFGQERHDVGRPQDVGYPIRGIIQNNVLYLRNLKPDRWPASNPETGYLNTDASPTKTLVLRGRTAPDGYKFWELCFGKRPAEELYRLDEDPDCVRNLADHTTMADLKRQLARQLDAALAEQNDPRAGGGDEFDTYPYAGAERGFYERYMAGEKVRAGWVNESDFEKEPLD